MNNEEFLDEMRRRREASQTPVQGIPQEVPSQEIPTQISQQVPDTSLGEVRVVSDKTPVQESKGLIGMLIRYGIAKNSQQANTILFGVFIVILIIIVWIWL